MYVDVLIQPDAGEGDAPDAAAAVGEVSVGSDGGGGGAEEVSQHVEAEAAHQAAQGDVTNVASFIAWVTCIFFRRVASFFGRKVTSGNRRQNARQGFVFSKHPSFSFLSPCRAQSQL